jgi:hypothetical protein
MKNKKFLIGMPVLLIAALFFLGCPTDSDEDPVDNPSVDEPVVVSALALTSYVGKPVTGGTPAGEFEAADGEYAGKVSWAGELAADGTFAPSTVYTATVALTVAEGYTFTGVGSFTHGGATAAGAVTQTANTGTGITVTIVFPITGTADGGDNPVDLLDLTGKFGKPTTDAQALRGFDAGQYGGTIVWDPETAPEDGKFLANTAYTATVTLTPVTGYTFEGFAGVFTFEGAKTITPAAGEGGTYVLTIEFDATAGTVDNPATVGATNLAGAIVRPVAGAAPVVTFTSPDSTQYTGTDVAWDPPVAAGGKFAAGTVYTAAVPLTAQTGYTFAELAADSFEYAGANVLFNLDTGTVTVTFGQTDAAVTATVLTDAIVPPVTGVEPGYVFTTPSAAQFGGGAVTWTPPVAEGGSFAGNTVYKAEVALTANAGYTFAGLAPSAFSYANAADVAFAAETGVVTVTFGKTDAVVSELDLSAALGAPVKGQVAENAVTGTQYAGTVTWTGTLVGTQFGAATGYTASATLAPLPGYTFAGFDGVFSYSGAGSVTAQTLNEEAGTVDVTVVFTDTDDSEAWVAVEFEPVKVTSSTGSLNDIVLVKGSAAKVTLTVAANSGYGLGTVNWYVDGNTKALRGTKDGLSGNILTLDPARYSARENDHHVTVTAKADGKFYSVTVPFKVTAGN